MSIKAPSNPEKRAQIISFPGTGSTRSLRYPLRQSTTMSETWCRCRSTSSEHRLPTLTCSSKLHYRASVSLARGLLTSLFSVSWATHQSGRSSGTRSRTHSTSKVVSSSTLMNFTTIYQTIASRIASWSFFIRYYCRQTANCTEMHCMASYCLLVWSSVNSLLWSNSLRDHRVQGFAEIRRTYECCEEMSGRGSLTPCVVLLINTVENGNYTCFWDERN